jgi:glycerol-3-phosphate O-acyltransferase
LKKLLSEGEHVILIPTYKSFVDMFLLMFALIENQIQLPFTIGNLDDTPRLLFDKLLRKIGYILMQRSRN